MSNESFVDRFDRFQKRAVTAICTDFEQKPNGRFLLVIPTGGGKTFTAVKSINALYENGVLDQTAGDRVLWVAHREELLGQAKETFVKYEKRFPERPSFKNQISFQMVGSSNSATLGSADLKLVVIDEAHHGAAASYQPIFERSHLGILGLTATPSRHDGRPLEFERESFSIGFPDLVERGIVLRPQVRSIDGGTYTLTSLNNDDGGLEALNNYGRNQKIIDAIWDAHVEYDKVVIYVGTVQHVLDLHQDLEGSRLRDKYESISWIHGGGNSRGQQRKDYFDQEKGYRRSIIVNVDILTEGYDDPSVNTVVMARPTASKLVYMQSMGRAIRHDPTNDLKRAFIVEVVDVLPNIRYRIDNRWLYSDISDVLEPAVVDVEFSALEAFANKLSDLYSEYNVPSEYRFFPEYQDHFRYTMLLFKVYIGGEQQYCHYPILIDNETRGRVSNLFNYLSERMHSYRTRGINSEQVFRMVDFAGIRNMEEQSFRRLIFGSMENASSQEEAHEAGRPWITFVTFRLFQDEDDLSPSILEFVSDCVNSQDLIEQIRGKTYETGSYLVRYPLPLAHSIGKVLPNEEFLPIRDLVEQLVSLRLERGSVDHREELAKLLHYSMIPIEPAYAQSLAQIVREDLDFFIALD